MKKYIELSIVLTSFQIILGLSFFAHAQGWKTIDSLETRRTGHSLILLDNGNVLAIGSDDASTNNLCELYNSEKGLWNPTESLTIGRVGHQAIKLKSGKVLVIGGFGDSGSGSKILDSCEIFDPETGNWKNTGKLNNPRTAFTVVLLNSGKVLAIGGNSFNGSSFTLSTCEIFDPETETWTFTGDLNAFRNAHKSVLLQNGKVLVAWGSTFSNGPVSSCEIYDPETGKWTVTNNSNKSRGTAFTLTLLQSGKVLAVGSSFTEDKKSCETFDPTSGIWTPSGNINFSREHNLSLLLSNGEVFAVGGGVGTEVLNSCEFFNPETGKWSVGPNLNVGRSMVKGVLLKNYKVLVAGGYSSGPLMSVEIFSPNSEPTIEANASPTELSAGETVSFSAEASDPDGDSVSFAWNFGDGTESTEQSPTHTYSAVGTYTATVTVTDSAGNTAKDTVEIKVLGGAPTARFTTSTVVGFVNVPLTFDGTLSTDPENNIASYSWDFGDESPAGTDKTISKIYSSIGSYTVKLTVTDGEGQTNTASRQIEVLSEEAAGSFNAKVEFDVRLNFKKENKDSFKLVANVNVGTQEVASGITIKVEFAGNTFMGELDTKLQDKSDKNEKWKVKANTTKQTAGEVKLQLKVKKANLAAGFQEAGVTAGDDPKEEFELELPIIITIGDRTIETTLDSTFKFNRKATKAKGSGELD